MQRTEVLSLPIFDNPKEDLFKIDYFNTGFRNIENIIGQIISSEGKVSVDLINQDCKPDFIDNDYAWDKLLRVKTSAGNNITFSLLEKYLDINYKNFDFTMEISLAQGTTLNISANGNVIKSITNENSNTQNLVYKVFVYTKDSTKRVINIMKISDSWEEFSIEQNV